MAQSRQRLRTGVGTLDRKLGGGIPEGSVVAVRAQPASQSELLLYELAAQRETLYLTTQRSVSSVRQALESAGTALTGVHVHAVDPSAPIAGVESHLERFDRPMTVVVDTIDPLEAEAAADLRAFLTALDRRASETASVVALHCLDRESTPSNRELTAYMADLVFDLATFVDDERVRNRLTVPKFRGGPALTDALRLDLRDRVIVDNSRDIA